MLSEFSPMKNPLILALDVDSRDAAMRILDNVGDLVGGVKLGPRLCLRYGSDLVKEISSRVPVFLDNKHFDIPSTMEAAVRASFDAGASLVTVHALSGREALARMAVVEKELSQIRPFRVLAVTVLTSWDQRTLPVNMREMPISEHVVQLAKSVQEVGLTGIVCSPHELNLLHGRGLYLVTPGIRFDIDPVGDQKRVMGPREAIQDGASVLVVGRPIVDAVDSRSVVNKYLMAIYEK